MYKRNIQAKIEKALKTTPVLLLTGARQTGKTTLVKELAKDSSYTYISFDDLRYLSAAKNDPIGFINGISKPVILDEVQRVPEIFLAIKQDVDENRLAGRYILTGSADPLMLPQVSDSLAGRMLIFELFPFSQGELLNVKERFIDAVFNDEIFNAHLKTMSREELAQKVHTGGYPSVQALDSEEKDMWFNSYITTILQRDVKELAQIERLSELPHLLQLLATRVGNLLNVSDLSRSSGISSTTLHRYLTLLKTVFMIDLQYPWFNNLGKRLVKSPKAYLNDTGVLSFLCGLSVERVVTDTKLFGAILENFIVQELKKQATWSTKRVRQYHYRTLTGTEVDIILEDATGVLVGIEVKSSQTVSASDFKGLKELQKTTGTLFKKGIVLYAGKEVIPFGQDLFALPIDMLWQIHER